MVNGHISIKKTLTGDLKMKSVWIVKLPALWKDFFDEIARNAGYTDRGAGAREVRKLLKSWLAKEGFIE